MCGCHTGCAAWGLGDRAAAQPAPRLGQADQHERLVGTSLGSRAAQRHSTYRYSARRVQLSADSDCFGGTGYSLAEEIHVLRDRQPVLIKSNSAGSDEIGPVDQVFVSVSSRRRRKAWRQFRSALGAEKHGLAGAFRPHDRHRFAARRISRAPNPRTASPILNGDSRNTHADGPR